MSEERKRYNILVEIPEKYSRDPHTGQTIVIQAGEKLGFKRYGKDEKEAEDVIKDQLKEYYTDVSVVSVQLDKTHPVKQKETEHVNDNQKTD
jgi:hypothetical protein